jgi:hypothetical protein
LFEREARSRNRGICLSDEDLKNPSRVAEALTADDLARAVRGSFDRPSFPPR